MSILDGLKDLYTVEFFNSSRQLVGQTDSWLSLDMVCQRNGVGSWVVTLPFDSKVNLIEKGGGVYVKRAGQYLIGGQWTSIRKTRDPDTGTRVELSGATFERYMNVRAYEDPTMDVNSQLGTAYDDRTGPTETLLKGYTSSNIGPAAIVARRVPNLTIQSDTASGTTIKGHADFDVLLELCQQLAITDGMNFGIIPDLAGNLQFQTWMPRDLSGLVRFSVENENLRSYSLTVNGPVAVREIVQGAGEGVWRQFRATEDTTAASDWAVQLENFIDSRDTTDDVVIDQRGAEQLAQDAPSIEVDFEPLDTTNTRFAVDYAPVGDKITVDIEGETYSDVIQQNRITVNATGESFAPLIGPAGATSAAWTYRGIDRALAAIRTQERRQ